MTDEGPTQSRFSIDHDLDLVGAALRQFDEAVLADLSMPKQIAGHTILGRLMESSAQFTDAFERGVRYVQIFSGG